MYQKFFDGSEIELFQATVLVGRQNYVIKTCINKLSFLDFLGN